MEKLVLRWGQRLLVSRWHGQNRLGRGVNPCWLLFTLLPCAVTLLQPGLSRALQGTSLRAPAASPLLLLLPLGLQGCFSHSCSPSVIAHGECFALSEQMLSLRHCCHGRAAGLSWTLLWLHWSCLEVAMSIAWQPQTLLTQASLQPLPVYGQLHSVKPLQEEATVFWYFFSGIILNIVSWSLFLPALGKVYWSMISSGSSLRLLHEVSCCHGQVEEALNVVCGTLQIN